MTERLVVLATAYLCLFCACHSGNGNAPPDPPIAEAALVGTWSVKVRFTRGDGTLASLVDTELSGQLTIRRTSLGYTVSDGATVEPLSVTGNYATFQYTEDGVTQIWSFSASQDSLRLTGNVLVLNEGFTAEGTLTGTRAQDVTGDERVHVTTVYDAGDVLVIESVRIHRSQSCTARVMASVRDRLRLPSNDACSVLDSR